MAKLPNYIPDINRFQLAGPPTWFLKQLFEFDASLVIVPSRQDHLYRLAQRRHIRLPEQVVNDVLKEQADTRMLSSYGLVPVTTIIAAANWGNPVLFEELHKRAPWRLGGAKKVNAMLEAQDQQERLQRHIKNDEMLNDLTKDAWKFYQKKVGLRSHLYSPKTTTPVSPSLGRIRTATKPYSPSIITNWSE